MRRNPGDLTPRERQVLDLIRLGLTNEEIAQRLGITLDSVKYHVSQILSKLGMDSRKEAALAIERDASSSLAQRCRRTEVMVGAVVFT